MSERSESRFRSIELMKRAQKDDLHGEAALLTIAASGFELAAAIWELQEFLAWAFDRSALRDQK